ncbi:MAG: hypothetical protein WCH46_09555 [bacterium]
MKKGSLPIAIAVTGHRDLRPQDIPILEAQVEKIFSQLEQEHSSSPLVLLSSLAEGADRLAARIALKRGIKLVCPLPMPRALYEDDFSSEESKKDFADLLDKSDEWFELPLLSGSSYEDISKPGELRNHQYAFVGAYLSRHSQIIIAMWDGNPVELVGGTTYVVGFKLHGIPPPYIFKQGRFDQEEIGPVYHILTPRATHEAPEGTAGTLKVIYPDAFGSDDAAKSNYDRVMRDTNRFNEDEISMGSDLQDERTQSASYLLSGDLQRLKEKASDVLISCFSVSDTLAIFFQKQTLKFLGVLFAFALMATVVFELYAYLMLDYPILLLLFFMILGGAYSVYLYTAKKAYQAKFLDYRTLAEGLRIQFYWKQIGIRFSVANYYLGDQHSELDWIRHALRIWSLPFTEDSKKLIETETNTEADRWNLLMEDWVKSQHHYFVRSSKKETNKVKKLNLWARIALILGFLLIAFNMIYQYFIGHTPLLTFLYISSVTPIAAGLFYGYSEKRALADHVKQYERMATLFAKAETRLLKLITESNFEEARNLVFDLGKEALKENGRWVLTHRERPIEFPITQ